MKKSSVILLSAVFAVSAFSFASCDGNEDLKQSDYPLSVKVVMPDGAPALSMAKLMSDDKSEVGSLYEGNVDYDVVDASTISTYVTGEAPVADLCVLPVNLASKLLGSGETYQMLGSVTHGNLYLLSSKYGDEVKVENLSSLKGKTVGVVNLANVPGLIFKSILNDNGVEYNELKNDGVADENKVNLKAIEGGDVGVLQDVDYYVAPEPAASLKVSRIEKLNFVGDLQKLYGGDDGYVQAVLVAKTSFIAEYGAFVNEFLKEMDENDEWLETASSSDVVNIIVENLTEGMTPTFNANNLTASVIDNCGISFEYSVDCKDATNEIISKFISINANSAKTVSDEFFNTQFKD